MRANTQEGWGGYLVRLAWELDELGFDSTVRFPPGGPPSLEIFAPSERPEGWGVRRGRASAFVRNRWRGWSRRERQGRDRGQGGAIWPRGREVSERVLRAARILETARIPEAVRIPGAAR
ncbi:hypothetical protein AB0395_14805 [Streptosporangium sp. NPDC051023]|uniref:hypothetical protein n=1 Tax=Streptosporangium sp. NPDC051023 TaxID=3155410 RepID=UPI0034504BB8